MQLTHSIQQSRVQKMLAFFVFCCWIGLFYQKIELLDRLPSRPGGEHAWAQIDRASMALTYYNDEASFWLPRCHQTDGNPEGITAGEFPLIPYTVSKMYAAWGFNEVYHRVFVLGITVIGFIFSFLLALRFIERPFWAALVAALWLASPNILYYSVSFLPDTPALAFLTIALFFLFRKDQPAHRVDLLFFSLFSALAILLKVSTLFPLSAVLLAFFFTHWKTHLQGWKNKINLAVAFIIPVGIAYAWIKYAHHVVETYRTFTFLMEPVPPKSWDELWNGMEAFGKLSYQYYSDGFLYFLLIATVIGLIFIRRSNYFLLLSALFIYLSGFFLFVMMIQRAPVHFYYWIPFQLGIFFHLAWLADVFIKSPLPGAAHIVLWISTCFFIRDNAIHVHNNVTTYRWAEGREVFGKYYRLEPKLEALGITYKDRVFSYKDETFNNSLYLMNRKGITEHLTDDTEHTEQMLNLCNYAVLTDTAFFANATLKAHFGEQLGEYEGMYIYRLRQP